MDTMVADREVDNPYYYGQPEIARRITVQERPITRIGALCFVKTPDRHKGANQPGRRYPHHDMAAELFKSRYEAAYGAGVPASDNARPFVDRTMIANDAGMASRIDRAKTIATAIDWLGKVATDRLVACLVLEVPAGTGLSWRDRQKEIEALLGDLDRLCEHWSLKAA